MAMLGSARRLVDQQDATDATLREIVDHNRRRASDTAWNVSLERIRDARRRNDFDAGDRLLEAALAVADLDLRSARDPTGLRNAREWRASASRALAEVRLEQCDFRDAARLYHDAIETFPKTAAAERWGYARAAGVALRRTATLLGSAEAASLAVAILRDAVAAAPGEADRHNELGLACIIAGELTSSPDAFEEAQTAYSAALSAIGAPGQAEAFRRRVQINRAVALCKLTLDREERGVERRAEAATLLRQAIEDLSVRPGPMGRVDLPRAWDNLGTLLFDQGKWDEAIAAFEKARDAWADADERARTLGNLGLSYAHAGRFEDALKTLDTALHAQPVTRRPLAWSRTQQYRGEVLRMYAEELYAEAKDRSVGLFMQAFETLSAAREQRRREWAPELWAETTAAMGMVFQQLGRPDQAVELYLQSLPYFNNNKTRAGIAGHIVQIFMNPDSVILYCTTASRKDLIADIQSVLNSHGIGRAEWNRPTPIAN